MSMCGVGFFFFQAEDGIRDLVRSRGLGDVYKRQMILFPEGTQKLLKTKGNILSGIITQQTEHI